jgi:TetR/AcrR family transcriptional regulator, regulator of cefoperazone and chloramphenicol sensitivity
MLDRMKSVSEKLATAVAPKVKAQRAPRKRLRHSAESGYARGDQTRQRIILAAMQLFGERGFEGATTRDIAAAADVNAPALQYYFDNKEGVYLACIEYIIDDVRAMFEPALKQAKAVLQANAPKTQLIEAFLGVYAVILDSILLQPHAGQRRLFLARELNGEEPSPAGRLLRRRLRQPFAKVFHELLGRISGLSGDDPVTRIRMMGLKGQIMPLHHAQRLTLESLGWNKLDANRIALIKATLLDQVRVLLEAWARR